MSTLKAVDTNDTTFSFDMNAKNTRLSDHDLLSALEEYAKVVSFRVFPAIEFDKWPNRRCQSRTISERYELINSSGGCDGPIAVLEFAEYPGHRDRADIPAVQGLVPVISHHETPVLRHCDFRKIGRRMALRDKNAIFCTVVFFIEHLTGCSRNNAWPNRLQRKLYAIDIDIAILDSHRITSDGDDAFDPFGPERMRVLRISEQDNITSLRVGIPVGIFDSNDAVTRRNGGIHGCAGDEERLNELVADIERITQEAAGAH